MTLNRTHVRSWRPGDVARRDGGYAATAAAARSGRDPPVVARVLAGPRRRKRAGRSGPGRGAPGTRATGSRATGSRATGLRGDRGPGDGGGRARHLTTRGARGPQGAPRRSRVAASPTGSPWPVGSHPTAHHATSRWRSRRPSSTHGAGVARGADHRVAGDPDRPRDHRSTCDKQQSAHLEGYGSDPLRAGPRDRHRRGLRRGAAPAQAAPHPARYRTPGRHGWPGPPVPRHARPVRPAARPGLPHSLVRRPGAPPRPRARPCPARPHQQPQRPAALRVPQPRHAGPGMASQTIARRRHPGGRDPAPHRTPLPHPTTSPAGRRTPTSAAGRGAAPSRAPGRCRAAASPSPPRRRTTRR